MDSFESKEELFRSPSVGDVLDFMDARLIKGKKGIYEETSDIDMQEFMSEIWKLGCVEVPSDKDGSSRDDTTSVTACDSEAEVQNPTVEPISLKDLESMARSMDMKKKRFFGIYPRVRVQMAWRRLVRLGVVLRSRKLKLLDLSANASQLMNNFGEW